MGGGGGQGKRNERRRKRKKGGGGGMEWGKSRYTSSRIKVNVKLNRST